MVMAIEDCVLEELMVVRFGGELKKGVTEIVGLDLMLEGTGCVGGEGAEVLTNVNHLWIHLKRLE